MNIHEYQAKQLLKNFGLPISPGVVINDKNKVDELINDLNSSIYVVKAQIHAGGRGKAGGVKVTSNKKEAVDLSYKMLGQVLITEQTNPSGQLVKQIYVESGCNIEKEFYLSIVIDRAINKITFIVSTEGGVNIEEVAKNDPSKIFKIAIDIAIGIQPFHCRSIVYKLGLKKDQAQQVIKIIKSIYDTFIQTDASQIEINPLVTTKQGKVLVLDAKMNFDDNALYRHPEIENLRDEDEEEPLESRAAKANLSYVRMLGNIGCMVNGAGLAMATMDIVKLYGAEPANFLDVGGGADKERVKEAMKIIIEDSSVKGILINIFGGIMRCDIIAEGIISAARDINLTVPLVVRLAGTNSELGKKILNNSNLKIIPADTLADAAQKIVKAI